MRAYVQQVRESDRIYLAMMQSAYWMGQRGYEVIRFQLTDVDAGLLDDDLLNHPDEVVVRGGVGTIRLLLRRAGRPDPPNLDLPTSLSPWIGRRHWESTLGHIRVLVNTDDFSPVHIKPLHESKLFTGTVVRAFRDLIASASISSDTPILVQECVEFVSEWRTSILRDEILNVAHYRGDPLLFPDVNLVRSAIPAFEGRPISFAMDWGVTSSGQTLLVEVNDGFSLGNYGLHGLPYTAMMEARWRQLMGLPDNGVGRVSNV